MQHAYNQAIDAWSADEVPVGAVIVHEEEIIAAAHNQTRNHNDPTAHAEMIAITMAAKHIGDSALERVQNFMSPRNSCPMCSGATIMSRIGEVHYSFKDPKMGGLGGAVSLHDLKLSNHKPNVIEGTLREECKSLVQVFFQAQRFAEPK